MLFKEVFDTQHELLKSMEACKSSLVKKGVVESLELGNASDLLGYVLLIARLRPCGFSKDALLRSSNNVSRKNIQTHDIVPFIATTTTSTTTTNQQIFAFLIELNSLFKHHAINSDNCEFVISPENRSSKFMVHSAL